VAAQLAATEREDGSWDVEAHRPSRGSKATLAGIEVESLDLHHRVHVTGHHVDWLLLLPADIRPADSLFDNAARFLLTSLLSASDDDILAYYCPYSHAAHALLLLARRERR
jgi:hypothetical protein